MKHGKHTLACLLLIITLLLASCSIATTNSSFSIRFIDVGQGDSALIECDGHYMLIDGGGKSAGETVYQTLVEEKIWKLDILAITHAHEDHIGGLPKVLTYASKIGVTICNTEGNDSDSFNQLKHELSINNSVIKVPTAGKEYSLGSAKVEIIANAADAPNDSLVILVTYGETKFLFTGDIEDNMQKQIYEKYQGGSDQTYKIDLIKLPHHGAHMNTLYSFLRTFMPDYVVISVGAHNRYGHPDQRTLDLLDNRTWQPQVYRTDTDGDILVRSDGKNISVETRK